MKAFVWMSLGLVFLLGIYYRLESWPRPEPPLATLNSDTPAMPDPPPAPEVPAAPTLNLSDFAAKCFHDVRERNPRGRLLRLSANRLGNRCSGIVETRPGSGRWLFDWLDGNAWVREGELVLPPSWPSTIPGDGITDDALAPEAIAARVAAVHAWVGDVPNDEWTYEVLWFPGPFERQITGVTLLDKGPEAQPYGGWTQFFDGDRALNDLETAHANELYPMTRFELREDHNFKGALYESTALAESAVSLETDPNADPDSALLKRAESCMDWLHKANEGGRVVRVGISIGHCYLTLENAATRNDFYLLTTSAGDAYNESPSLQLDASELPNLLLDRSRVTMPRLRERLAQVEKQPGGGDIDHIAVFWLADERMLWQFSRGPSVLAHLDEAGRPTPAPEQFPITRAEVDAGFPASSAVMEVVR
jgi:hypothetical protein